MLVDTVTAPAAEAFVGLAGLDADLPLRALQIRQLGGALLTSRPDPGAAGPLESEVLFYAVGAAPTPEAGAAVNAALAAMSDRLAPWVGARRTLLTFDSGLDCGTRSPIRWLTGLSRSPRATTRTAYASPTTSPPGNTLAARW